MDNWVDFKIVKQSVSMEQVVAHYGLQLRPSGPASLRGRCPLPTHSSKDSKLSFTVNTAKNVWSCLSASCKSARGGSAGGNLLDFVAAMERCSVRDAALRLASWFPIPTSPAPEATAGSPPPRAPTVTEPQLVSKEKEPVENNPLAFTLQGIRYCDYLQRRGISQETAQFFGVGLFPGRGSMAGRVVIPIHNEGGALIAYAGRAVDQVEPKYKFPAGFHKSQVLFNLHRTEGDEAIVVEGFFDCMKVSESGFPTLALMGCSLSPAQEDILVRRFKRVIVLLDGDEAGQKAAEEIAARLLKRGPYVRVIWLSDARQPDQLSTDELKVLLSA